MSPEPMPFARVSLASLTTPYVRVRDDPGNRGKRMAYHDGVLELMSLNWVRDEGARLLLFIVAAYCKEFRVPSRAVGATSFRKGLPGELKGDGKEPDESFYLGDAVASISDKTSINLDIDPAPTLWIELDNWGSSTSQLPIYARLGVPEVWRYRVRKRRLWFGELREGRYHKLEKSIALPGLTAAAVLDILDDHVTMSRDTTKWLTWLENDWFPGNRSGLTSGGAG